jgi:hypothetical protein
LSFGFSPTRRRRWRRAGRQHCPSKPEAQCRDMIKQWVKAEELFTDEYVNPTRRETEKGLFVDSGKRPRYS